MNLPMKIKRTLPSISLYSPIARKKALLNNNTQPPQMPLKSFPSNQQIKNKRQSIQRYYQSPPRMYHSPQRIPIFQSPKILISNNPDGMQNRSSQKIKKAVTFAKINPANQSYQQKNIHFNSRFSDDQNFYVTNSPQRNISPSRKYKRRSIFQKSKRGDSLKKQAFNIRENHQKIGNQVIPVLLNVKQFSDRLKKAQQQKNSPSIGNNDKNNQNKNNIPQSQPKSVIHPNKTPYIQDNSINQSQLLKKIDHIQHIIENIQQKIIQQSNSKQKQQKQAQKQENRKRNGHSQKQIYKQKYRQKQFERPPDTSSKYTNNQIQNNLLKLQLEQMKRCQRIAKQNQILYGKLVRDLQKTEYQMKSSRKSPRTHRQLKKINNSIYRQKYFNLNNNPWKSQYSQSIGPNITAFQDFVQARELSNNKYTEQNIEIASPFEVPENRTKNHEF